MPWLPYLVALLLQLAHMLHGFVHFVSNRCPALVCRVASRTLHSTHDTARHSILGWHCCSQLLPLLLQQRVRCAASTALQRLPLLLLLVLMKFWCQFHNT